MDIEGEQKARKFKAYRPQLRANLSKNEGSASRWEIRTKGGKVLKWSDKLGRVSLIRQGLPFEVIDAVCEKSNLTISKVLEHLNLAQTTYNKKKRENGLLSIHHSELLLILSEVLDFGLQVFNQEEQKFHRWLKKPNASLGNNAPENLFDSITGILEVRNSLNRIEYGNLA